MIQNGYNLLDAGGDSHVRRIAAEHGIAYTAYPALGSGVLTGKDRRGQAPVPPGK